MFDQNSGIDDPVVRLAVGEEDDPVKEFAGVESVEPTQSVASPAARLTRLKELDRRSGQAAVGSGQGAKEHGKGGDLANRQARAFGDDVQAHGGSLLSRDDGASPITVEAYHLDVTSEVTGVG